ncbi:unnamed protein product [Rhizoctonia solani]|uniref:Uncharacterized protein n=1 Tax=Rhizoctonia solani TaxID=456999 RepID=A0A8H2WN10_9AGAM|nr:unnamed protein product [Rhizoctonia solani]
MISVKSSSFCGCRTTTGIYARFLPRNPLQSPCFKPCATSYSYFLSGTAHAKNMSTQCSRLNNISSGLDSVVSPDLFRKLYGAAHSATTFGCPTRAFNTLCRLKRPGGSNMMMHPKDYSTDQSKKGGDSTTTQKPPPEELRTHIEAFFAKYPGFEYDPTKPCMDEFKRLNQWARWKKKSNEFEEARKGMNEALTEQFNAIYGKDPGDIVAWRNLCSVLDLAEIPTEISACKRLIKSLYINIVDLVDQPVTNVRVGYFRTEQELASYTREKEKFYSLQAAKAGGLLKRLLRFIEQPRRKGRSNPKLRKTQNPPHPRV